MDKLPADFAKTEGRTFSRLKNECLARIDRDVQATVPDIGIQMGVIMMAQVLAFRRLLNYHGVTGRGQRLKLVKAAVASPGRTGAMGPPEVACCSWDASASRPWPASALTSTG